MSRTSQQARHDTINLERLLRRLEAAAEVGEGGSAVATGDDNLHDSVPATETSTAVKEQQQPTDYYQTLATLSVSLCKPVLVDVGLLRFRCRTGSPILNTSRYAPLPEHQACTSPISQQPVQREVKVSGTWQTNQLSQDNLTQA